MQKIRKRETSPNPEYSIKYKVMIKAHQDNVFEQLKRKAKDLSAITSALDGSKTK
jgi:hypothetical protein